MKTKNFLHSFFVFFLCRSSSNSSPFSLSFRWNSSSKTKLIVFISIRCSCWPLDRFSLHSVLHRGQNRMEHRFVWFQIETISFKMSLVVGKGMPMNRVRTMFVFVLIWLDCSCFFFQPLHKRTPSQTDIAEFKDLTKRDALTRLQKTVQKLVTTASTSNQKVK